MKTLACKYLTHFSDKKIGVVKWTEKCVAIQTNTFAAAQLLVNQKTGDNGNACV